MKAFFLLLQHRKITKAEKQSFFKVKRLSKIFFLTALSTLQIVAILLASARNVLKFYCFDSVQSLVSFVDLNFIFFLCFWFICCRDWHCFQFGLKLWAKMSFLLLEKFSYKECIAIFVNWRYSIFLYHRYSKWFSMQFIFFLAVY